MVIVAVIVCVLAVGVIFIKSLKNRALDGPDMEYKPAVKDISYTHGQDEYGRATSWHLHDWQLEYRYNGGTVEDSTESRRDVAIDFYNTLEDILNHYEVKSWTSLPASELEILDGPSTSCTIEFTDGTIIKLGDAYQMPENGWKAVNEIISLFEQLR